MSVKKSIVPIAIVLAVGASLWADQVTRTYRVENRTATPRSLRIVAPCAGASPGTLKLPIAAKVAAGAGAAPRVQGVTRRFQADESSETGRAHAQKAARTLNRSLKD